MYITQPTTVHFLFTDPFGNRKTVAVPVWGGVLSLSNIWSGVFGVSDVSIIASVPGVQTLGSVVLSGNYLQAPVSLTFQTLVPPVVQNTEVTAAAVVLADGSFSVQDIQTQGLSEGVLTVDVVAQDANVSFDTVVDRTPELEGALFQALADGSFRVQDIQTQGLSEGVLIVDVVAQDANVSFDAVVATDVATTATAKVPSLIAVLPVLLFTAVENELGNIDLFGTANGLSNGALVSFLFTDGLGNSKTASAVVTAEEFSVTNIWTGTLSAGHIDIIATSEGVQTPGSLELSRDNMQATVGLTSYVLDANMMIDVQGIALGLEPGTVLTLVIRDEQNIFVTATAEVQANGSFSVQDIDTQGLSEGVLTFDVVAMDVNAVLNLTNIASLVLTANTPQGADNTLNATEDTAYVLTAAAFGYSSTQGYTLTGVKIAGLPTNGTLKRNGVAVNLDDVISKADIDAGKLTYQGALNGNGPNYASFQFKVQDSRAINNEDTTANQLTFNVASVNDAPWLANAIADQTTSKNSLYSYAVPVNAFVDVDSTLTYSATMADGSGLPSWLTFNTSTRTFSGTPPTIGNLNIMVKASDGTTTLSDVFMLTVGDSAGTGINLSTIAAGVGGFIIDGGTNSGHSGYSVSSAGDVNGDGLDDVIVSAIGIGGTSFGPPADFVVFGKANMTPVKLTALGTNGFQINQQQSSDNLGQSVSAAGDVNGDGLADLLVSAYQYDVTTARFDAGRSYVVFGKADNTAVQLANVSAGVGGFAMNGNSSLDFSGYSLSSAGDVNGDGLADVIVGAYKANEGAVQDVGRSYVVYGRTASSTPIELSALGTGGLALNGTVAGDYSGWSVSGAGDVNGDGYADLIVGAYQADPNGTSSGNSYVVFGKAGGGGIDLSAINNGVGGYAIRGGASGINSGYSVSSAGDVNGDGLADVIVGAPQDDSSGMFNNGRSYVVFGKTTGTAINLTAVAAGVGGFVISGSSSNIFTGYSVSSAGDINGDGLADLLIGSPESTVSGATGYRTGQTFVVYGKATGTEVVISRPMASSLGFAVTGEGDSDLTGAVVSGAGDVNGDGLADLVVSTSMRNVDGVGLAGRTYVILGSTGGAFKTAVDVMGTSGNDNLSSGGTQTLIAAAGNDTLVANGADVLHGGSGNDVFVLGASTITALANLLGAGGNTGQLARVVGGTGFDTVRLSGGALLDLTLISNSAAGSQVDATTGSRIDSIERIDLATDTAANTLTLTAKDVNDMAGFNLIHTGSASADGNTWTNVSGTALSTTTKFHQLVVTGASSDVVNLSGEAGWANAGTVNNGTSNYTVWQNTAKNSQVLVQSGATVTNTAPASATTTLMLKDVLQTEGAAPFGSQDLYSSGAADSAMLQSLLDQQMVQYG